MSNEVMPEKFIEPLFSKPVYCTHLNIDTKKIVSMLEEYSFDDLDKKDLLKIFGFSPTSQSKSLYILDDEKFKFLKNQLMSEFYSFIQEQMRYTNKFDLTTSWFTKSVKGQSSSYHNHNNCMFSAVLYLQTDENSGDIKFQNMETIRYQLNYEQGNLFNSIEYEIKPTNGMFIIFPSEVWHKITQNNSDITRYSLAMNFLPTGFMGFLDSQTTIKVEKFND
tara:strand:- start:17 stop:679 length:663 start_codon:yes stop_codon:yes gene_type:complete